MASRVKLNADPKEGVGTVNADVAEERVLETRGSEGDGVAQPRTAGEKDPGIVVGEGSVEGRARLGLQVGGRLIAKVLSLRGRRCLFAGLILPSILLHVFCV